MFQRCPHEVTLGADGVGVARHHGAHVRELKSAAARSLTEAGPCTCIVTSTVRPSRCSPSTRVRSQPLALSVCRQLVDGETL